MPVPTGLGRSPVDVQRCLELAVETHCDQELARRRGGEEEERRGREEKARRAMLKPNNPHLAGGKINYYIYIYIYICYPVLDFPANV